MGNYASGDDFRGIMRFNANCLDSADEALADDMTEKEYAYRTTAAETANAALANAPFAMPKREKIITNVRVSTGAAVVASATDFATISVWNYWANGTLRGLLAVANTNTIANGGLGNIAAHTPIALTVTVANAELEAGGTLEVQVAKAASGVALGPFQLVAWAKSSV